MARTVDSLLTELEQKKTRLGDIGSQHLKKLVARLSHARFHDARSLARFHDLLLFLRTFPPSVAVFRQSGALLKTFLPRIKKLLQANVDLSLIQDEEEFAGIAGTTLTTMLDYDEARWLADRFPGHLEIDWSGYEHFGRLGATLPRFMPLLEEDAFVEPDVPYLAWLQAASHKRDLKWLIAQFEHSDLSPTLKSEIFGSLELPIRWSLADCNATRTHAQRRTRTIFFHRENLIQRRDVSLASELAKPPLKLNRVSVQEGQTIITMCREATSVRYRELYGTTRGDTSDVVRADVGRGVEIFLWGLPANKRLPLRAYQAGFTLKNGRPINYIEAISLFECMEIGFNTFYAYRDGETAWIYAQVLRALHRRLGVKCISVYPYQIGKDNEEALASGAFWFYRKLGFRPVKRELEHLAKREEAKIAAEPGYRTPLRTLRRLAEGHVVYELPDADRGAWDNFRVRTIGIELQRLGSVRHVFRHDEALPARTLGSLGVKPPKSDAEKRAQNNFALLLRMIPDFRRWDPVQKSSLVRIIHAKSNSTDAAYAKLLIQHHRFRKAIQRLGSKPKT